MALDDDPTNASPKAPAQPYVCWRCGESLPFALFPLTHSALCPHCRADLHACRLCRHHDRTRLNQCRHERANAPNDRTQANYCTYFRPRLHAFEAGHDSAARQSEQALAELFGAQVPEGQGDASPSQAHTDVVDDAREALEALFAKPDATDQDKG